MPKAILLFSGKRKSGKDYLTDHLKATLSEQCEVIKISQPIKSHWAKENSLNLNELLSDTQYKEQHRKKMIDWSEEMRAQDYGCFCRVACENAVDKPVWIVSDIRRKTDIKWFKDTYGDLLKIIRIVSDEATRESRGYVFQAGVDDIASECDLDNFTEWDLVIDNGKDGQTLDDQINSVLSLVKDIL